MLAMLILVLELMRPLPRPMVRVATTVADGSVWADWWRGDALVRTQRLRAPAPRERWLALDVDGDGQGDLVAIVADQAAPRVEVWLSRDGGFILAGDVDLPVLAAR